MAATISSLVALIPDPALRRVVSALDPGAGLIMHVCAAPGEAERLHTRLACDVVLAADGEPGGLPWLVAVRSRDPDTFRILACAEAGLARAVEAVNRGDIDAILRIPLDAEQAQGLFQKGCEAALLRRHNRSLVDELAVRNAELVSFNERLEDLVAERTRHLLEAQQRLQEQQRQLVQLETQATVTHLLRGLAHEFNNPLAAIQGYAQRLRRNLAHDPDAARRVDVILDELEQCKAVVGHLRQLSSPLGEDPRVCDPGDLLGEVLEQRRAGGSTTPELEVTVATPAVLAAPHALHRVFEHVLANAIDAGARRLRLSGQVRGERARIEIANDGAVPDEAAIENAVRPFFTTRAAEGHRGLGLSLAAALLREQDGTIQLRRGDGNRGAVITLVLPAARPGRSPSSEDLVPVGEGVAVPATVVLDDEPMVAAILAESLGEAGHRGVVATSLAEATAVLSREPVRALFLDLNLPDGNGVDFARRIIAARPDLAGHIALMTGDSDAESLRQIIAETGLPVLGKPFRMEQVHAVARQIG